MSSAAMDNGVWSVALLILAASTPLRFEATVEGSIEATLTKLDPQRGAGIAAQVARLLRWQGNVARQVQRDDKLLVLTDADAQLLALEYNGQELHLTAVRFVDPDGIGRYYDQEGRLVEPKLRDSPLKTYEQITEVVQSGRGVRRHHGLDLKAPRHTPVYLPFDAVVSRVNWSTRRNGRCVEVMYTSGAMKNYLARFLHLQEVAPLKVAQKLPAASQLGTVGSSGHSGAPHLHYEIRNAQGEPVEPLDLHGTDAGWAQPLDTFKAARDELLRLLHHGPAVN